MKVGGETSGDMEEQLVRHGHVGDCLGAGFRCPGSQGLNDFSVSSGTGASLLQLHQEFTNAKEDEAGFRKLLSSSSPVSVSLILQNDPRSSHRLAPLLGSAHSVKAVGSHFKYSTLSETCTPKYGQPHSLEVFEFSRKSCVLALFLLL